MDGVEGAFACPACGLLQAFRVCTGEAFLRRLKLDELARLNERARTALLTARAAALGDQRWTVDVLSQLVVTLRLAQRAEDAAVEDVVGRYRHDCPSKIAGLAFDGLAAKIERALAAAGLGGSMTVITNMKRNDTKPEFTATLTDGDGNATDLSSATEVRFLMHDRKARSLKVNATAEITDAANGRIRYIWASGDTDTVGEYDVEVQVTFSDGTIESYPNNGYHRLRVLKDLGP